MKIINKPNRENWERLCERPTISISASWNDVDSIIDRVSREGDKALLDYNKRFDQCDASKLEVTSKIIEQDGKQINDDLKEAIKIAYNNIYTFHKQQMTEESAVETMKGVVCWRKKRAIQKVGLYVPGGTAPLFSTLLMLGIPAKIAGCQEIIVCTPAKNGIIDSAIYFAASLLGNIRLFKLGGAQAIAAMALGTAQIPKVDKIFGPGNSYVTLAKQRLSNRVAIDMPAGPSELMIICDETANSSYVAADILSQAEHGMDSQIIVICNNERLATEIVTCTKSQCALLPRKEIAESALLNSRIILLDKNEYLDFSNMYAAEHLIINTADADDMAEKVINAGSVFIGAFTPESLGDYASGTNHTLPTAGFARSYSGVSVDSFVKNITFQKASAEGIKVLGPCVEVLAEAEQLTAHKLAVTIRLNDLTT